MNGHSESALQRDGCVLLRGAIPAAWLPALRDAFESGTAHVWPVPRGGDWRHAYVEQDQTVQRVCRLPALLAAVGWLAGGRFFLAQVEGREPLPGGGQQMLHRDAPGVAEPMMGALAFLDDYGPANGATRYVACTHGDCTGLELEDHPQAHVLEGAAGDIFIFAANLLHGGTRNVSGTRRRSLLISYPAAVLAEADEATRSLRSITMPREFFEPA